MTGKIVWHVTMSLDGYIAGADDDMDWMAGYGLPAWADEIIAGAGAILAGRRGYNLIERHGDAKPYGGRWHGPLFVLTHRPPAECPDPTIRFLSDDLPQAVDTALTAAGGKNLVLFGATIPRQCLAAGLLDDIIIHLAPVLLGDGIRLYENRGAAPVRLERVALGQSGQITDLRLRPM